MKYLILCSISIFFFILSMVIGHSKIESNKFLQCFLEIAISIPICIIIILLIYDHTELLKDLIITTSILIAYFIILLVIEKMYKKNKINKYIFFIIIVLINFITIYCMNIYLLEGIPYNVALVMSFTTMFSLLKKEEMRGYKSKILFALFCVLLIVSIFAGVIILNQNLDGTSKPMHKVKKYLIEEMKIEKNQISGISQYSGDNKKEKTIWVYVKEKEKIIKYVFIYFEGNIEIKEITIIRDGA